MEYLALFESAERGGYVVSFPDFGRGVSQGDNDLQAMDMARELLRTLVDERLRGGQQLPPPAVWRGGDFRIVRLPG